MLMQAMQRAPCDSGGKDSFFQLPNSIYTGPHDLRHLLLCQSVVSPQFADILAKNLQLIHLDHLFETGLV